MKVACWRDSTVSTSVNPLNAELNPNRHLLSLVGARHFVHVSRIRVKYVGCLRHTGKYSNGYGSSRSTFQFYVYLLHLYILKVS